jgi:two-component system, NarL family, invasion response regulator UvrY
MIRIFIADDHSLFRAGVCEILAKQSDLRVVGEAGNGIDAMTGIRENECDVVLLDVTMPGLGGLEILADIKRGKPHTAVLVLSMHPEDQYATRVLKSGASGYLTKESAAEELIAAIRKVASGGIYVSAHLAEKLASSLQQDAAIPPHQMLSGREFAVLTQLVSGKKLKEIAHGLCLSEKTITTYRARILRKLNLRSNAELVHYAIQNKLIE